VRAQKLKASLKVAGDAGNAVFNAASVMFVSVIFIDQN